MEDENTSSTVANTNLTAAEGLSTAVIVVVCVFAGFAVFAVLGLVCVVLAICIYKKCCVNKKTHPAHDDHTKAKKCGAIPTFFQSRN